MTIDMPVRPSAPAQADVPPAWEAELVALVQNLPEASLWWRHSVAPPFEVPARSLSWLRPRVGRLRAGEHGRLRPLVDGDRTAQVARVGSKLSVELMAAGATFQVALPGAEDDGRIVVMQYDRVCGCPAALRAGHGHLLGVKPAAAAMWAWCARGEMPAGYEQLAIL